MSVVHGTIWHMETYGFLAVGLALGLIVGWLLWARSNKGSALGQDTTELQVALASANARLASESERAVRAEADFRNLQEQVKLDKSQESIVLQRLAPVAEQLQKMEQAVSDIESKRSAQHSELATKIAENISASQRLASQTTALTRAMTDSRARGAWGEVQLKRLVEEAGLLNRVDFFEQNVSGNSSGDTIKPDMVIQMPGGNSIPVDSKVPFDAYLEAQEIEDVDVPAEAARQKLLLEKHASDLKGHVKKLGGKNYWEGYANSPEFVIAFIPSESLLSAALKADPSLLEYAMSNKVLLASPVNLFSILKSIALIWQNTADQESLKRVIKLGQDLFNRLAVVAKHADSVGKALGSAGNSYNDLVASLERNLFTTARDLNKLDATQFGVIEIVEPRGVEEGVRGFTKFEVDEPLSLEAKDSDNDSGEPTSNKAKK